MHTRMSIRLPHVKPCAPPVPDFNRPVKSIIEKIKTDRSQYITERIPPPPPPTPPFPPTDGHGQRRRRRRKQCGHPEAATAAASASSAESAESAASAAARRRASAVGPHSNPGGRHRRHLSHQPPSQRADVSFSRRAGLVRSDRSRASAAASAPTPGPRGAASSRALGGFSCEREREKERKERTKERTNEPTHAMGCDVRDVMCPLSHPLPPLSPLPPFSL